MPYGGTSKYKVDLTQYVKSGNFCDVSTQSRVKEAGISAYEISVFDGDCFLQPFEFVVRHSFSSPYQGDDLGDVPTM